MFEMTHRMHDSSDGMVVPPLLPRAPPRVLRAFPVLPSPRRHGPKSVPNRADLGPIWDRFFAKYMEEGKMTAMVLVSQ